MQNRRPLVIIAAIVAIAIALPVVWYLFSPLFIDQAVNEAFPTSVLAAESDDKIENTLSEDTKTDDKAMDEEVIVKETATIEEALTEPDTVMEEAKPAANMATKTILAQGEFYDIAHDGMGTASVYLLEGGSSILRFEDFEVLNGPELHVYLTTIDPVPDTVGVELEGVVDLGLLTGNIGNQNYELPPDIDISQYKSVVIWCEPFRVAFNAAPLVAP